MSYDISGYGLQLQIVASITFPAGVTITQFADDADPFDLPSIQIAEKAMGLNGDLIIWAKAQPINVTVSLVPNSPDDINLQILLEANRVGRGKLNIKDDITLTGIYPDNSKITLIGGKITDGMPGNSVASAGRLKSKSYIFTFENRIVS